MTGVHENLSPVLIFEDSILEILTIQIKIGQYNIRIINAYGPQEGAGHEYQAKVTEFYSTLDQEVKNAFNANCLLYLEFDANAKVGSQYIKGDNHSISQNGIFLVDFVTRNNLVICNGTSLCEGSVTRERTTINGTESSIIDFVITCQDMYQYMTKMKIDKDNALARYSKKKNRSIVSKSDHHLLVCDFNIRWSSNLKESKVPRQKMFNFKDQEGQKKYKILTSQNVLSDCFKDENILANSRKWLKTFNNILYKCFPVVRLKPKSDKSDEGILRKMQLKSNLYIEIQNIKNSTKSFSCKLEIIVWIKCKIDQINYSIASITAERNANKIKNNFKDLTYNGNFHLPKMWSLKKKLNLNNADVPSSMRDKYGNLITQNY